jgi:flagellar biosynthesis protein FlhG
MKEEKNINPFKITVTSGKGGVGKSFLVSNLAYIMSKQSIKTLVFDADSQFPNQHLIFGAEPPLRLSQVYSGQIEAEKAIFKINNNLDLLSDLPATGIAEYYSENMIIDVFTQLLHTSNNEVIIFDTPSGAGNQVLQAASISDLIILVINDEPTSLLDAYGLIKILRKNGLDDKIKLIVNNVIDFEDADEMSEKLNLATKKFLRRSYESLGFVPYNRAVRKSIIEQELLAISDPFGEVSESMKIICDNLLVNINLMDI